MSGRTIKTIAATLTVVTALSAVFAIAGSRGRGGGGRERTGSVDALGHERQDRCVNGNYRATFAGFYRGTGSASVDDKAVHLRASLTDKSGRTETFDAVLASNGPYFSGSGTIFGKRMTVRGRIDAARQSRVAATYFVEGHGGRLIAELPAGADTPDEEWEIHTRPPVGQTVRPNDPVGTGTSQSGTAQPGNGSN